MIDPPSPAPGATDRGSFLAAAVALTAAIVACSAYANLSIAVTDPAEYGFFPPFEPRVNANDNRHLSEKTEYAHIARSLIKGKGFADPFARPTGPTAWMPPVLPVFLAGLAYLSGDSRAVVLWVVVAAQVLVLAGTGVLVLALARRAACRIGPGIAAAIYLAGLLCHFRLAFQSTHDSWLILLTLDLLIAGVCWLRPLGGWWSAAGWGVFGGFCALVNPIVAFAWGVLSIVVGLRERARARLAVAVFFGGLTLLPWMVRNYL